MMMDVEENRRVQEEADRWFARLMAPDCDDREREAFERWRRVPEHGSAYAWRERLWQRFGAPDAAADPRLQALRERVAARTAPALPAGTAASPDLCQVLATLPPRARPAQARNRRRARWSAAIAASICVLAVMFGLRFTVWTVSETVYASTDTLREFGLKDGTRLQLDVDTEITVRYGRRDREVVLHHGRALFDVTHDAQRPFTVDLGDSHVTVLGTRFQVLREPNRVSVTLERGSLQLDGQAVSGVRRVRLAPGEQISYSSGDPSAWLKRKVDSAAAMAWSRGRLIFRSTPLAEAVQEVNRYAHPKLRLADPSLSDLPVSGNFIAGDSALVASTWAATLPLRSENRGNEIVLQDDR